jgi:hypothetical protein
VALVLQLLQVIMESLRQVAAIQFLQQLLPLVAVAVHLIEAPRFRWLRLEALVVAVVLPLPALYLIRDQAQLHRALTAAMVESVITQTTVEAVVVLVARGPTLLTQPRVTEALAYLRQ